jgi:hypothetical protein
VKTLSLTALLFVVASGCVHYTPYTAPQLAAKGTHPAPGQNVASTVEAVAVSLTTLGYRVTVKDAERGIVKTSAKPIMTSATTTASGGQYSATASSEVVEDGLAWALSIEADGSGAVVHATPRGFRNGTELHDEGMWVAEVMDAKFNDLWNELDSTLGLKR